MFSNGIVYSVIQCCDHEINYVTGGSGVNPKTAEAAINKGDHYKLIGKQ